MAADNDEFALGTPALVCRWRLAQRALPLEARHLRALAARTVDGKPLPAPLCAWVKQHVEWTLADGAAAHPDGVLMLVVDEQGRAAMSCGPYEPLEDAGVAGLAARARTARSEAACTGVAPEELWAARGGALVRSAVAGTAACGAASLVCDLARTRGQEVLLDEGLLDQVETGTASIDEAFLVSDEHGVVPASDALGACGQMLRDDYRRLLEATKA